MRAGHTAAREAAEIGRPSAVRNSSNKKEGKKGTYLQEDAVAVKVEQPLVLEQLKHAKFDKDLMIVSHSIRIGNWRYGANDYAHGFCPDHQPRRGALDKLARHYYHAIGRHVESHELLKVDQGAAEVLIRRGVGHVGKWLARVGVHRRLCGCRGAGRGPGCDGGCFHRAR
jgi:hypothetical protein